MLMILLLVVFVAALVGGGIGQSRIGYVGWSPAGVILLVVVLLFFTGHLHYGA